MGPYFIVLLLRYGDSSPATLDNGSKSSSNQGELLPLHLYASLISYHCRMQSGDAMRVQLRVGMAMAMECGKEPLPAMPVIICSYTQ